MTKSPAWDIYSEVDNNYWCIRRRYEGTDEENINFNTCHCL